MPAVFAGRVAIALKRLATARATDGIHGFLVELIIMVAPPRKAAFIRAKPPWLLLGLLNEALAALFACDTIQCRSGYRSDSVNRRVLYVARYHVAPTKGLYGFFGNTEDCGYLSIARTVPAHLLYLFFLRCRHISLNMKGALYTAAPYILSAFFT